MLMSQLFSKRIATFSLAKQSSLSQQQLRAFSQFQTFQQPQMMNLEYLNQQINMINHQECEDQQIKYECKKNKTTKQAEKKRKKRKTGADISIRHK
eukprot:403345450